MNKIKVEERNIVIKEDTVLTIKKDKKDINYIVETPSNIFILILSSDLSLSFDVKESTNLNIFSLNSTVKVNIDLTSKDINLNYAYSTFNKTDNFYKIKVNHLKENITSKIVNHGINLKDNILNFEINTIIPKESYNIETSQDSKIITKGEKSSIKPNLIVKNYDAVANHSAYLGDFKKEDIFYLESRGISKKDAQKLLSKAFLIGPLNITFRQVNTVLEILKEIGGDYYE